MQEAIKNMVTGVFYLPTAVLYIYINKLMKKSINVNNQSTENSTQ